MKRELLACITQAQRLAMRPQDVFKATPYTGNAASRTITNGLNLSASGSLVWASALNGIYDQYWSTDAVALSPNTYEANFYSGYYGPRPVSTGFTLANSAYNEGGVPYMSWSFKKAPKFFTSVRYVGSDFDLGGQSIPHDLGTQPGLVIIKDVDNPGEWRAWHIGAGIKPPNSNNSNDFVRYMGVDAGGEYTIINPVFQVFNGSPTASSLNLYSGNTIYTNEEGVNYIAYLFAADSPVIKCGSVVIDSGSPSVYVNLGWRPQFLMIKALDENAGSNDLKNWNVHDSARSWKIVRLNGGGTEYPDDLVTVPDNSGFTLTPGFDARYYYMAIRGEV